MTIEITHTRREGTLIEGTSRNDGSKEVLRTRHYASGYTTLAKWSRNLGCWYLPYSRDKRTSRPMLEALAERFRAEGFEVSVTIDETDRRTFAEAEQDRTEQAEARTERFGQYADNASTRSKAAWRRGHDIADGIPMGQPILVGHHSERRARRDQERMDSAMRTSIDERDKAAYWADREKAAAGYEQFRRNAARTLRRIDKLNAELRAVEKWQRGESAHGFTQNIGNPDTRQELELQHQELTEEIAYWQDVIKEAEVQGFKVWSRADFRRGDYVRAGGKWWEVLRVNAKSLAIPHIHIGIGKKVIHAADMDRPNSTWRTPYDEVTGRKSAAEMQQPPQAEAAEPQEQAEQSPPVEEPEPAAETCPMCHSSQWHAEVRGCAHCHHAPEGKPTPAAGAKANWQEGMALVLIVSKNSRRSRKRALWAMTRREAQAVCGDPRTSGRSYMLTWTERPGTEGADWEWVPDNGSLAPVLEDLGIAPRREWTAALQAPAA